MGLRALSSLSLAVLLCGCSSLPWPETPDRAEKGAEAPRPAMPRTERRNDQREGYLVYIDRPQPDAGKMPMFVFRRQPAPPP